MSRIRFKSKQPIGIAGRLVGSLLFLVFFGMGALFCFFIGREFRSNRYKFMSGSSSGRKGKAGIVRRFPAGSQAACYVNLRNPADARTAGL